MFAHLHTHGAITEAELTHLLGSTRLARRFAMQFDVWLKQVPFMVRVESTSGGKRYVRVGLGAPTHAI
ncbi:MAG: hypothetical protein EB084_26435 [Proteobacteria bacterium]|nr:hypothetical protein [Pseudomonadota bacterium]